MPVPPEPTSLPADPPVPLETSVVAGIAQAASNNKGQVRASVVTFMGLPWPEGWLRLRSGCAACSRNWFTFLHLSTFEDAARHD
jgi:hypothetical protein